MEGNLCNNGVIKFHEMLLKIDMINCIDPTKKINNFNIRKKWGKV